MQLDWSVMGWWDGWEDLAQVRAVLASGSDPNRTADPFPPPLTQAAARGSEEVVAELAALVADVDAVHEGHTALWAAVFHGKPGNARVLVEAGADPWRPIMAGWSPAKLALAGPTPDLFPSGEASLSPEEQAAVARAPALIAALRDLPQYGHSIACVAGITAAEASRRMNAVVVTEAELAELLDDPIRYGEDVRYANVLGATDVPGGCVITQPWSFLASRYEVIARLSHGTRCYGMFANAKSGSQGAYAVDGEFRAGDLHPGAGAPLEDDPADIVLTSYLYQGGHAEAFCCGYAGLRLTDARPILGPPDLWMRIPLTS